MTSARKRRFAGAACEPDPVAGADAALLRIVRMHFKQVFLVPQRIGGSPRLRADIILRQDAAGGEKQRKARSGLFVCRDVFGNDELALAADETVHVHDRRAVWRLIVARPLHRTAFLQHVVGDIGKVGCEPGDLVHNLRRMVVMHVIAERLGEQHGDLPVLVPVLRRHDLADTLDTALGVGKRAVLFKERRTRQEHVSVARRFVQEQVLHDDAFHCRQTRGDVMRIRVGLKDVLALDVNAFERCRRPRHRACWGCAGPALCRATRPNRSRTTARVASSEMCR